MVFFHVLNELVEWWDISHGQKDKYIDTEYEEIGSQVTNEVSWFQLWFHSFDLPSGVTYLVESGLSADHDIATWT